jgi:hypothetical protein
MPSFGRYEQCAGLVRRIRERHPGVHADERSGATAGAKAVADVAAQAGATATE